VTCTIAPKKDVTVLAEAESGFEFPLVAADSVFEFPYGLEVT